MTLLLYAVTPADAEPPEALFALRGARTGVVHARKETAPTADRDAVLAFGRTIEQITRETAALPMRFGTTVADLAELRLLVAQHEDAWSERLAAVAGCCELIVHLDLASEPDQRTPSAGMTGREYLLGRAEAAHERQAARDEVRTLVGPVVQEHRLLTGAGPDRLALLLPRTESEAVRADLERWAAGRPGVELAVTGPWAPFSFCEATS